MSKERKEAEIDVRGKSELMQFQQFQLFPLETSVRV
jgi:hypothetical protein